MTAEHTAAEIISVETARRLYDQGGGGHDFDHVLRVYALAERIGLAEGANLAVVRVAALLHDAGESQGRELHHLTSAAMARRLLADQPAHFVDAVAHAIEAHRFRAEPAPATLEAQVVSDADKLDSIGAIGIARACAYSGSHGHALWRASWHAITEAGGDPRMQPDVLGADYTPVHEFVYKLNAIPSRLYTSMARAIAAERQAFMHAFFDQLDAEVAGER